MWMITKNQLSFTMAANKYGFFSSTSTTGRNDITYDVCYSASQRNNPAVTLQEYINKKLSIREPNCYAMTLRWRDRCERKMEEFQWEGRTFKRHKQRRILRVSIHFDCACVLMGELSLYIRPIVSTKRVYEGDVGMYPVKSINVSANTATATRFLMTSPYPLACCDYFIDFDDSVMNRRNDKTIDFEPIIGRVFDTARKYTIPYVDAIAKGGELRATILKRIHALANRLKPKAQYDTDAIISEALARCEIESVAKIAAGKLVCRELTQKD